MATKFTVTLPDGTTGKRTSASRTYTHVVAVADSVSTRLVQLADRIELAELRLAQVAADSELSLVRMAELVEYWRGVLTECRATELELAERSGDEPASWGVLTWCGRLDLADKAARSAVRYHGFVRVIPVNA